jgi:hypothetical protein
MENKKNIFYYKFLPCEKEWVSSVFSEYTGHFPLISNFQVLVSCSHMSPLGAVPPQLCKSVSLYTRPLFGSLPLLRIDRLD